MSILDETAQAGLAKRIKLDFFFRRQARQRVHVGVGGGFLNWFLPSF